MSELAHLAPVVERLSQVRVLCVGDVMLDRFVYGHVDRVSPEAPIPILRIDQQVSMLGGAGNVVRNLGALGVECCFVAPIGDDAAGEEITRLVSRERRLEPHLLVEQGRRTTVKIRYVAGGQQLLRADEETVAPIGAAVQADLLRRAHADLEESAVLAISDYGKGALSDPCLRTLIGAALGLGRPVVVDPKGNDYRRYRGATGITPNCRELAEATRMPVDTEAEIVAAARHLRATHAFDWVLVTRSADGMSLVGAAEEAIHLPAQAREVFDVSGAGDTVAATMAAGLAAGLEAVDAARLANAAAGIVVGKVGTAVAEAAELQAALRAREIHMGEAKTVTLEEAAGLAASWRAEGLAVGFTNGCFDLLHPGHISLLGQARQACDRLVVGLNSDASVARLKGPGRPIQSEAARAVVLGSLTSVDIVVVFEEDTPLRLIEAIRPDVLVKGRDYTIDQVVGADVVQGYGGRVVLAELAPGHSTTATVRRIAAGR